jgi:hypothetical protein
MLNVHCIHKHSMAVFKCTGLEAQVSRDIKTMRFLAGLMGRVFPEYEYTWYVCDYCIIILRIMILKLQASCTTIRHTLRCKRCALADACS